MLLTSFLGQSVELARGLHALDAFAGRSIPKAIAPFARITDRLAVAGLIRVVGLGIHTDADLTAYRVAQEHHDENETENEHNHIKKLLEPTHVPPDLSRRREISKTWTARN